MAQGLMNRLKTKRLTGHEERNGKGAGTENLYCSEGSYSVPARPSCSGSPETR